MTRVLHVIPGLGYGGAERLLVALVTALPDLHHAVLSLRPGGALRDALTAAGAQLLGPDGRQPEAPLADAVALGRAARRARPDVIHGWTYAGAVAAAAAAAACVREPALVLGLHAASPVAPGLSCRSRLAAQLAGLVARRAGAVICPGPASLAAHRLRAPATGHAIAGGIDTDAFAPAVEAAAALRARLGLPAGARILAHVARDDPAKDHPTLLAALAHLGRPDVHLVIAGPGLRPLPVGLRAAAGARQLHLLGPLADVRPLLRGSDLFSLSSRSEALPVAAAEAMACGTPAVLTDVGDCATVVGAAGRLVPPGDPAALAAAWAELLDEPPAARRARRRAARAHACAHLARAPWAAAHRAIYTSTVPTTSARRREKGGRDGQQGQQ